MIRVSPRFAPALLGLGLAASVPVWLHGTGRLDHDDCANPGALQATLLIPGSRPVSLERGELPRGVVQRSEGTLAWALEREYPLQFSIVRSVEPTSLTRRPFRFVLQHFESGGRRLRWLERDGARTPVHYLFDRSAQPARFVAYVYLYESQAVEQPLPSILAAAPRVFTRGPRPFTLMIVGGAVPTSRMPEARRAAEDWLLHAQDHYRNVCRP